MSLCGKFLLSYSAYAGHYSVGGGSQVVSCGACRTTTYIHAILKMAGKADKLFSSRNSHDKLLSIFCGSEAASVFQICTATPPGSLPDEHNEQNFRLRVA